MPSSAISFLQRIRLLWLAFRDKRTPLIARALVAFAALYGVSPVDAIPDVLPLVGELDDIAVGVLILIVFLRMTKHIRADLQKQFTQDTTASVKHSSEY